MGAQGSGRTPKPADHHYRNTTSKGAYDPTLGVLVSKAMTLANVCVLHNEGLKATLPQGRLGDELRLAR